MKCLKGLSSSQFEQLWSTRHDWFEPPNYRRGGWSGVSRLLLENIAGQNEVFFKQQFRHAYRSWQTLFLRRPTAWREYRNIEKMHQLGIATVDVVLFGVKSDRALLATRALTDYQSLDSIDLAALSIKQRSELVRAVADLLRQLHQQRYQHNCLYPKHIFVRRHEQGWSVKLIDLEKMRRRFFVSHASKHDLDTLYRRGKGLFSQRDQIKFLRRYFGESLAPKLIRQYAQ